MRNWGVKTEVGRLLFKQKKRVEHSSVKKNRKKTM